MLKEIATRRRALVQAVDAEERAGREVVASLRALTETLSEGTSEERSQAVDRDSHALLRDLLQRLLKSRAGAASFKEDIQIACQDALEALGPLRYAPRPIQQPVSPVRLENASEASASLNTSVSGPLNNSDARNGQETSRTKLTALGVSFLGLEQCLQRIQEELKDGNDENVVVLLGRMKNLKKLTMKEMKKHEIGQLIGKLVKSPVRGVRTAAIEAMQAIKQKLAAEKEERSKSESMKIKDPERKIKETMRQANQKRLEAWEKQVSVKEIHPEHSSVKRKLSENAADKNQKKRRLKEEIENDGKKKEPKKSKAKKLSKEEEKEEFKAWMRERRKKLAHVGSVYEKEEAYSSHLAEMEDFEAEMTEREEMKRRKKKGKGKNEDC